MIPHPHLLTRFATDRIATLQRAAAAAQATKKIRR